MNDSNLSELLVNTEEEENKVEEKITHQYQRKFSLKHRMSECKKIREKYPDKVPVVLKRSKDSKNMKNIGVVKYLVQDHITVSQFMYIIRKKIKIDSTEALYLYANEQNILKCKNNHTIDV